MLRIDVQKKLPAIELSLELEIFSGFTALHGPSGSGKTTILNLISGLVDPTDGEIVLKETVLYSREKKINLPPQKRHIGYIFQESRLFPHLSVRENLEFGYKRLKAEERQFSFAEIVDVTGVGHLMTRLPGNLSGGEKQRVAIARALLASPEFLLMDEPLAALDLPTRYSLLKFIKEIHVELNVPVLYVTHDVTQVLTFADKVIVLKNGRFSGYGTPFSLLNEMFSGPLVPYEDIPNIFEATLTAHDKEKQITTAKSGQASFILPYLDVPVGEKVVLNIPASEVILATQRPDGLSANNILRGTIREMQALGKRILVAVDAGLILKAEIVPATVKRLKLEAGKDIYLIIKASAFKKISESVN